MSKRGKGYPVYHIISHMVGKQYVTVCGKQLKHNPTELLAKALEYQRCPDCHKIFMDRIGNVPVGSTGKTPSKKLSA